VGVPTVSGWGPKPFGAGAGGVGCRVEGGFCRSSGVGRVSAFEAGQDECRAEGRNCSFSQEDAATTEIPEPCRGRCCWLHSAGGSRNSMRHLREKIVGLLASAATFVSNMSVELTESLFSKAAGWEAMKRARAYLEQGQVLSSNWTSPVLKGVVQAGEISFRARFVQTFVNRSVSCW
jgi:hypothetical protein